MRSYTAKPIQRALLLVSLFLTACGGGGSVISCITAPPPAPIPAPVVTSMGTDFYLTLPDHLCVSAPPSCPGTTVSNKLIVAAATATTGEVTFYGVVTPFSVAAGGEFVISFDPYIDPTTKKPVLDPITNKWANAVLTNNEVIEAKGIHVTSLSPISVHVVSESAYSADGYLALPTAGLGTSYYVMSYPSVSQPGSEFAVVATQNNTSVTITPKAAGLTKPANVAFTILLNRGETYLLENPAYADMTGTSVIADKPIAVFSGHRFGNVPSGTNYGDYLVEQLPDVSIWGKTHHTSLFGGRSSYTVRVMASQNGTTFTTSPPGLVGPLDAGQFADVTLYGAGEFVSNNPVLVAQYIRGYADENVLVKKGDPSMVIVTPAEQGMTDSTFWVHGLAGTTGPYMNIVTETSAIANLKLDNVAVGNITGATITVVGGTSIYSSVMIPNVTPGVHNLNGAVPYSAIVYDFGVAGNAVSYAYPVAEKLSLSVPVTNTPAPSNPSPAVCVNNLATGSNQSDADSEHEDHASNDDEHDHHDHRGDKDDHELEA